MDLNLLAALKHRQDNNKCIICGKDIKPKEEGCVVLYHSSIGGVSLHRKHIKKGG